MKRNKFIEYINQKRCYTSVKHKFSQIFFLLHKIQNAENGFHIILICTDVSYNSQCICNNVDKCFILRTSQTSTSNLMCRSLQIVPHTTNLWISYCTKSKNWSVWVTLYISYNIKRTSFWIAHKSYKSLVER